MWNLIAHKNNLVTVPGILLFYDTICIAKMNKFKIQNGMKIVSAHFGSMNKQKLHIMVLARYVNVKQCALFQK